MAADSILLRCRACRTLNRVPADKAAGRPVCGQCKSPLSYPQEPINATAASFDQQVNDWPGFALVEFWAKWCGYCRAVEPLVAGLASKRAGRLKVIRVDVDAEPALARRFQVKATPTFILHKNGVMLARLDGAPAKHEDLTHWLDDLMR